MMKIAVLMLVHKNAEKVKRLISVLKHENVDIFIHINKNAPLIKTQFQTIPTLKM